MFLNCKLEIDNAKPKTKITFEIFDPIILPMDKSGDFLKRLSRTLGVLIRSPKTYNN